jgi:hypothetical protein
MHRVYKTCGAALVPALDHHQDIAVGVMKRKYLAYSLNPVLQAVV